MVSMLKRFSARRLVLIYAFLVILGVLAIWILNPKSILEGARDKQRFAELESVDKAIGFAMHQDPNIFLGEANVVYLSLPDLDGDRGCLEYKDLPPLTLGWRYVCVSKGDITRVDGTGWIPIKFNGLPIVTLDSLPFDPLGDAKLGFYYAYVPGWEIDAQLESKKYQWGGSEDRMGTDGGNTNLLYEAGSDLTLMPASVSDRTGKGEVALRAKETCGDGLARANLFFTKWMMPGSGVVTVIKLWYFQPDSSLQEGSRLRLALYNAGMPNYTRISDIVEVLGTGQGGWLAGVLKKPVMLTLGQSYFFGADIGEKGLNVSVDKSPFCDTASSQGGSYVPNQIRELGREAVLENQSADSYGFFGVSYVP